MNATATRTETHRLPCSSPRAIRWAKTQDPERVMGIYYTVPGHRKIRHTCGTVARKKALDQLHEAIRWCEVPVDLDALSPEARRFAAKGKCPEDRTELELPAGVTRGEAQDATPSQIEFARESYAREYVVTIRWPRLLDDESGEAYYQRVADLAELARKLHQRRKERGLTLDAIHGFLEQASAWRAPWALTEALERAPVACVGCAVKFTELRRVAGYSKRGPLCEECF